jgi:hypothetical protein
MPIVSPKLGEFLVKTTKARDIDDAFEKVFTDYLDLKLRSLEDTIKSFQAKWNMDFGMFREKIRTGTLDKGSYSFDVERDFWEWEEAETLRDHYLALKKEWM